MHVAIFVTNTLYVLAIQTLSDEGVVFIYSTHGTDKNDFTFLTRLVIDEFCEGFLVAWYKSNRKHKFS